MCLWSVQTSLCPFRISDQGFAWCQFNLFYSTDYFICPTWRFVLDKKAADLHKHTYFQQNIKQD